MRPLNFLPLRANAYRADLSPPAYTEPTTTQFFQKARYVTDAFSLATKHFRQVQINLHASVFLVVDTKVSPKPLSLKMDGCSIFLWNFGIHIHKLQFLCSNFSVLFKEENYSRMEETIEKNVLNEDTGINRLATDFFFNFSTPVFKM